MTRINVGVNPQELCDQHLIAEYRELPRMWNFIPKSKPPHDFVLGKGHMLWCSQYHGMLADRYSELVKEMLHRGFVVNFPHHPAEKEKESRPNNEQIKSARIIVLQRLSERMSQMRERNIIPRWTNRFDIV